MTRSTSRSQHPRPDGRRWGAWGLPLALALLAGACSGTDGRSAAPGGGDDPVVVEDVAEEPVDDRAWPVPDWTETSAAEAGLDEGALAALAAAAEAGGSECLVVTRGGELVDEWYWKGFDATTKREVFSASKSTTSALVGIAQDRGLLDIEQPASDFIEEWQGTPSEAVTIRNLISNDSGRYHDLGTDYGEMAGAAEDKTAFSIGLTQQHDPGTAWVYNNAAIQTLEAVLEEATGMPVPTFAEEALFGPIGMQADIKVDAAGNALTFMGVQASCRDMARFGLLYEREGEWNGEQVVSAEWVAESTRPSQGLNRGYGFLWWLREPDAAEGTQGIYVARGLNGQLVVVFPDDDVVVTRLGAAEGDDGAPGFGEEGIVTGIHEALGEPVPAEAAGTGSDGGAVIGDAEE